MAALKIHVFYLLSLDSVTILKFLHFLDYPKAAFENKLYVTSGVQIIQGLSFDISQAFNKVQALIQSKFPPYLILYSSILPNTMFSSVSDSIGQFLPLPILLGVPQGLILAPLLYSIYTSDISSKTTAFQLTE